MGSRESLEGFELRWYLFVVDSSICGLWNRSKASFQLSGIAILQMGDGKNEH